MYRNLLKRGKPRTSAFKLVGKAKVVSKIYGINKGKDWKQKKPYSSLDFDGDGKINYWDCEPLNYKKQDVIKLDQNDEKGILGSYSKEDLNLSQKEIDLLDKEISHFKEKSKNFEKYEENAHEEELWQRRKRELENERKKIEETDKMEKERFQGFININKNLRGKRRDSTLRHEMAHHFLEDNPLSSNQVVDCLTHGEKGDTRYIKKCNKEEAERRSYRIEGSVSDYPNEKKGIERPAFLIQRNSKDLVKSLKGKELLSKMKGFKVLGENIYTKDEYQDKFEEKGEVLNDF